MPYDLLIKNGRIVDGSGRPSYISDVAIKDGRIVEIAKLNGGADRVIDADGMVVCPGFVDIHTHYDAQVTWDPLITSSSWNGVTTAVMGNCGFTIAPVKAKDREYIMSMLARVEGMSLSALQSGPEWDWETTGEYLESIGKRLGINLVSLAGHSAIRYHVMGQASLEREATDDEIAAMKNLLRQCMSEGAMGFSSSLARTHVDWSGNPVPSRFANYREIYELGQVLGEFNVGGMEITPGSLPTIDDEERRQLIRISRDNGRFLSWNELFQAQRDPDGWKSVLQFLHNASLEGAQVYGICSVQPTDADWDLKDNNLTLLVVPEWKACLTKTTGEKLELFADPAYRNQMRPGIDAAWESGPAPTRWDISIVAEPNLAKNKGLAGTTIRELAKARNVHPLDALLDLALEEDLKTVFAFKGNRNMDPEAIAAIMKSPQCVLGISDAGAHLNMLSGAEYSTYVLSHWVRERGVLSLEQAIYKLTFMNASLMGLTDRGLLRPGYAADVLVLDPDTVRPLAKEKAFDLPNGEERIVVHGQGIKHTIVNGEPLMEDNTHSGAFPGKVLKSTDYGPTG